jgi:hypothetical protein
MSGARRMRSPGVTQKLTARGSLGRYLPKPAASQEAMEVFRPYRVQVSDPYSLIPLAIRFLHPDEMPQGPEAFRHLVRAMLLERHIPPDTPVVPVCTQMDIHLVRSTPRKRKPPPR